MAAWQAMLASGMRLDLAPAWLQNILTDRHTPSLAYNAAMEFCFVDFTTFSTPVSNESRLV
jgi:hypothetical protein